MGEGALPDFHPIGRYAEDPLHAPAIRAHPPSNPVSTLVISRRDDCDPPPRCRRHILPSRARRAGAPTRSVPVGGRQRRAVSDAAQGDHRAACRLRLLRRGRRPCLRPARHRTRPDPARGADRPVSPRRIPRPRRRYLGRLANAVRHRAAGHRGHRALACTANGRRTRCRPSARTRTGGARPLPSARAR